MKLSLKAHPKSKFEKIIEHEGIYHCYFNVPSSGGRANKKIIEMVAEYFKVPKSNVKILLGEMHSEKVIEIKEGLR